MAAGGSLENIPPQSEMPGRTQYPTTGEIQAEVNAGIHSPPGREGNTERKIRETLALIKSLIPHRK